MELVADGRKLLRQRDAGEFHAMHTVYGMLVCVMLRREALVSVAMVTVTNTPAVNVIMPLLATARAAVGSVGMGCEVRMITWVAAGEAPLLSLAETMLHTCRVVSRQRG